MPAELDEALGARLVELTRRARAAADRTGAIHAARRDRLAHRCGYEARVREDPEGPVLVLYPTDWLDAGRVDLAAIDDLDRAVELPLDRRTTEDDWPAIHAHNMAVADAVEAAHGPTHGATARALGTYLSNHHLRRIEAASAAEVRTFRTEYFPRNAWPSPEQRAELETSIALAVETADRVASELSPARE